MSDFLNAFNRYNYMSKQLIIFFIVICAFWTVPFCLFKPKFFTYPFYAQFAMIFALSIAWFLCSVFTTIKYITSLKIETKHSLLIITVFSIFLLSISILISYYFTKSFTFFLRIAFGLMSLFFVIQLIYWVKSEFKRMNIEAKNQPTA